MSQATAAFTEAQLQAISAIVQQAVLPLRQKEGLTNGDAHGISNGYHYTAPENINDAPDRVKFAYWVPNVSGGLVISKIPQRTKWDYESNVRYAQTAENVGFEFALSQIRFMAGYGAVSPPLPLRQRSLLMVAFRKTNMNQSLFLKHYFTAPRS